MVNRMDTTGLLCGRLQGAKRGLLKVAIAGLGGLAISALSTPVVLAQPVSQPRPRLQDLVDSIPDRSSEPPVGAETQPGQELLEPASTVEPPEEAAQEVRIRLSLSDRQVYAYRGDTLEASFPVAVGKPGWETPTGTFEVTSRLESPGWTSPFTGEVVSPGPDNPLGDRWIGFWSDGTNVIGFHGTPTRESVGRAASHGCVRMYNEDIRQLFEIVALGTTVVVEQ